MCAYFSLLRTFAALFLILTILILPTIFIYSSKGGLQNVRNYSRSRFSMGNMGFDQSFCVSQYIGTPGNLEIK